MGRKPAPSKSIPKTTSPPRVRRRNTYDRVTALSKHIGKNQETLGYSFDTKRFGNSFCLQRVSKDSHFVQKDFPVMYVFLFFFLSKYFLSSHGANSRFFENTPLHGSSHCPEKPRGWQ